ncbi:molybdopterin-dependent oxidoreductase [Marinibaculum pumilum]|uniref:Molybdopterin-dependent oxidoreductase n=1 Tax=Marinibaculum pumilum TaxID=1766165 RepID=A0ABV7KX99_9PROT
MVERIRSACPHDCPSACALEVERIAPDRIGRVHGARDNPYTQGVVCAKVARYAERVHHPDRLTRPQRRVGAKGEGAFAPVSWDDALDEIAEAFTQAAQRHGSETVWPYHSGGTMGLVQRWGIDRLRHTMRYSRQKTTICITPAESGWRAGVGALTGPDPREMAEADLIIVWGGNPVSTQVNQMTHIQRARKSRGAKLAVVDCYRTPTVEQADIPIVLRPGSDAALACAMMCVMLEDGTADRDFLARLTDFDPEVERHLRGRTPAWAAKITGLTEATIRDFARLYAGTERAFIRLGFGFTRSRNGAAAMHAVTGLPAVGGKWRHQGGGAFFVNLDNWKLDLSTAYALDRLDPDTRVLDQSRIGAVLTGQPDALAGGPPVTAMLMQNANSANVAPDSRTVRRGLTRDDLFVVVHEQFPTATAQLADVLLPAAVFLEYDDLYYGLGHTMLTAGQRVLDRYAESWTNHEVICALGKRLGADHPGFDMSAAELLDTTLRASGRGSWAEAAERGWVDFTAPFEEAHFLEGFPQPGGRFRFKPDWAALGPYYADLPEMPDYADIVERADDAHPFRLVAPPARTFLNTSFTETPSSRAREKHPTALVHPMDAERLGLGEGARVRMGNGRGEVDMLWRSFEGLQPGTVVVEGIWPNSDWTGGMGINQLIGGDPVPPAGGVAFHDTAVWLRGSN